MGVDISIGVEYDDDDNGNDSGNDNGNDNGNQRTGDTTMATRKTTKREMTAEDLLGKSKSKTTRRDLPDVLELDIDGNEEIATVLDEAAGLQREMDKKTEGSIAWRLEKSKDALAEAQQAEGLEGLRHNNVVFSVRLNPGRESTDAVRLIQNLLGLGVKGETIKTALEGDEKRGIEAAKKKGADYWVRDLRVLK